MAIHLRGLRDAGADEIIGIVAASAQGKGCFRRINQPDKSRVGRQSQVRVRRQTLILEIAANPCFINHPIPTNIRLARAYIHRKAIARRNHNLPATGKIECVLHPEFDPG